ncbi:FAD-dependent oxidoreductase [Natronomonas sp. EA1]|uniref:FAD-dependent oxidoreductase n=1 Tax=Natronomonas sp. EA1 TaxID=3421655 RepID=UPI003EBC8776
MDPTETTVLDVRDIGTNAVAVELDSPEGFEGKPGQFVKLTATIEGDDESRFYTISSPDTAESFELTIGYDPEEGGPFSAYLMELDAGDTVTVTGPFGSDFYEGEASVLVLAGGPGIGPAVGIAEAAQAEGNRAAVVYLDEEPLHEARLAGIAEAGGEVTTLADDDRFADAVAEVFADDQQVFIYGFADFLDLAKNAVEAAGGDPTEAKAENFG